VSTKHLDMQDDSDDFHAKPWGSNPGIRWTVWFLFNLGIQFANGYLLFVHGT
jgi:hypothetical protein